MKRKILAVCNMIVGVAQIIFLLFQNRVIGFRANVSDIEEYEKKQKMVNQFMTVYMWILFIAAVALFVFAIASYRNRKKEHLNFVGDILCAGGHVCAVVGLGLAGSPTIMAPICLAGGIVMLVARDR